MRTSRPPLLLILFCGAFVVGMTAGALNADDMALPPCSFIVRPAGAPATCGFPFPPEALRPVGMNSMGEWVGYRYLCDDPTVKIALRWSAEAGLQSMPLPPGSWNSFAAGINDRGTIVGFREGTTNGIKHGQWACIWMGGQFIEIPPADNCSAWSGANAVNNADVVVGWRDGPSCKGGSPSRYAFIWQAGQVTDIDPTPFGTSSAQAIGVSENGIVAGYIGGATLASGRAFRWTNGVMEILQPLAGGLNSTAFGVNNSGMVVGRTYTPASPDELLRLVPTIWRVGSGPESLALLPGYRSGACIRVNNANTVLGWMSQPQQAGLAHNPYVLWIDGVPHALGDLVGIPAAIESTTGIDLNDRGTALCVGGDTLISPPGGAWLMSPTSAAADLNGDCRIDGADLSLLLGNWGLANANAQGDLNHDGRVDGVDLGLLLGSWSVG